LIKISAYLEIVLGKTNQQNQSYLGSYGKTQSFILKARLYIIAHDRESSPKRIKIKASKKYHKYGDNVESIFFSHQKFNFLELPKFSPPAFPV
jgi:hypothetical protein